VSIVKLVITLETPCIGIDPYKKTRVIRIVVETPSPELRVVDVYITHGLKVSG